MIDNIKYWCNKILPLVYDDSLSYYEVLCKTSAKLNEVITSTNGLLDAWDTYKNDMDARFGEYTAELDTKFNNLSDKLEADFVRFKELVNNELLAEFTKQNNIIKKQDDKIAEQDDKITAISDKVNSFIAEYNKTIAEIPSMVVDAVNAWLNDDTHYDKIVADLAGSIQGLKHFDTVADLKTANFTQIAGKEVCVCENYYTGDGVFTMWEILKMTTPPEESFAEGIVHIALPHADSDLYYRVAVLRSDWTASTLGIASATTIEERSTRMVECTKRNFNPILIDADFSVDLSEVNTLNKTVKVYSNPSEKHTLTLVNGNNFISSFKDIKIMHNTKNLKHSTQDGVSFYNCDILTKGVAAVTVSNLNIKSCFINASQINSDDEYTLDDYVFSDNTWTTDKMVGIVLTSVTLDSLRNCIVSNNRITNTTPTRTRLFFSPNIPAHTVKITDNVIYNPHVSADTPIADGIIGAFTSIGSASEFTLTVTGNTVYSSTLNTAMTLGNTNDTYHKFTMMYKDNNIIVNSGTVANPKWSSVLSTMIQTNGALYTNFIGDLDTSAKISCSPNEYMGDDVEKTKVLPFDISSSIGYKPQSDGTLLAQEDNAYYRAELSLVLSSARQGDKGPHYVRITFGNKSTTMFLSSAPFNFLNTTLYLSPNDIKHINGIMQLTILSNYSITTVNASVKLFRLA